MTPTIGRTVLYVLNESDVQRINVQRQTRLLDGNGPVAGEPYPMTIVRVWPNEFGSGVPGVNGHVLLDGNDALWVTSAREGTVPGTWYWPPREDLAAAIKAATSPAPGENR